MPGTSLTVEFLGVPGAGKSTVSVRVAQILSAKGIRVEQPSYPLAHGVGFVRRAARKSLPVLREILTHPVYAVRSSWAILSTRQDSAVVLVKMIFNWLLVSSLVRCADGPGVHLYDQGIFQALWSIELGGRPGAMRRLVDRLGAEIPLPRVVTVLEASQGTSERRLDARPDRASRLDRRDPGDRALLTRSHRLFEHSKEVLAGLRAVRPELMLLEIDNDRDEGLEANAARLAVELERILARP